MAKESENKADTLWGKHNLDWRDPAQVAAQWSGADEIEPGLLSHRAKGGWWETLARLGVTLLVTREYEHLVMAVGAGARGPRVTYMRIPHPSGIAVDREARCVFIASTRNPNQIFVFRSVKGLLPRSDLKGGAAARRLDEKTLIPVGSLFLPGSLYIHDLAISGGGLYAAACGHNAVVRVGECGGYTHEWWPRCVERKGKPDFGRNYIQLNSIAAGADLETSYYTASANAMTARTPGQRNYPVDGRGVIFSGATREPVCRGLTRPHSARLYAGRVWVDNSGYGEIGHMRADSKFEAAARLPGWTRGLCIVKGVAFVGTSRVIPKFKNYAPGLDVDSSVCGVHAVELKSGRVLGGLVWPSGNQIFSVDHLSGAEAAAGFPFAAGGKRNRVRDVNLFYAFDMSCKKGTIK